jgi:hypothetical protein
VGFEHWSGKHQLPHEAYAFALEKVNVYWLAVFSFHYGADSSLGFDYIGHVLNMHFGAVEAQNIIHFIGPDPFEFVNERFVMIDDFIGPELAAPVS